MRILRAYITGCFGLIFLRQQQCGDGALVLIAHIFKNRPHTKQFHHPGHERLDQ